MPSKASTSVSTKDANAPAEPLLSASAGDTGIFAKSLALTNAKDITMPAKSLASVNTEDIPTLADPLASASTAEPAKSTISMDVPSISGLTTSLTPQVPHGHGCPHHAYKQNILSDLAIPKPTVNVLVSVSETATKTSTTATEKNSICTGKLDKMLTANNSTSARNLYAIDYLKQHGPTPASEFKNVWDGLDQDMLKEYQAKSTLTKKNMKSTTNT
ncbi:hypothetical protein BJ912DRAFT_1063425 [Pholiota molesta]|nr:hypothetical protein BJ912DRAFT_1063425 [Pholiota molesta]